MLVNARKEQLGRQRTRELLRTVSNVVAVKGKKTLHFSLEKNEAPSDELLAVVLGPSGNLRAPTLRVGKTLVVGFHPDVYADVFGIPA